MITKLDIIAAFSALIVYLLVLAWAATLGQEALELFFISSAVGALVAVVIVVLYLEVRR